MNFRFKLEKGAGMDKLRALQYLAAAAAERSFSGASRSLEVSVPAVMKSINGLERELGTRMFDRTPRGLALTAAGAAYLEACSPALERIAEADEQARNAGTRVRGTIVAGVQHVIANGLLTPALPLFHARHPEIELDLRAVPSVTPEHTAGLDVLVVMGWPKLEDMVHRQIGTGRFIVVASPSYWARYGKPTRPSELSRHVCMPVRALDGTVMDLWSFARRDEREEVAVSGWLTIANSHREVMIALVLAGEGVHRMLDWSNLPEQRAGLLERVLEDWESPEAPPVNLLYRPSVRRSPRVRLFIDFITDLFREAERSRDRPVAGSERPLWMKRRYPRASAARRP